jgi:periplasmic protein TonB
MGPLLMAVCQSCGQKMKWYVFRREICQNCSSHWDGLLAKANVSEDPGATAVVAEDRNFYDLDNLLSSIQVREVEHEQMFSDVWVTRPYPAKSFATSVVLHIGMVTLAFGVSGMKFSQTLPLTREVLERDYDITYYKPADLLPKITSASDGPKDAAGERKDVTPPKGSTAFHPTQIIQSAPPKPDNPTQTIIQPSTPDVQIKQEVKVPNIVVWNVEETKLESIQISSKQMSEALSRKPDTPEFQPPDPENVQKSLSELTIAKSDVINLNPKLMLHPGASPEWNIGSDSGNPGPLINVPTGPVEPDQLRNMVVLSANPGLPGPGGIKVPPGNRTGAFSISPEGNRAGSPDGIDGGLLGGGVPGGGGSGKGNGFGSGGNIAQIQIPGLSIKGGPNNGTPAIAGPGKRPRAPAGFSEMVTIEDPGESYNITVVEGSRGGAGLGVYGVLSGKRNYTVFVPMPAGRWIMQFSEMSDRPPQPAVTADNSIASGTQSQVLVTATDPIVQPRPLRKVDPGRPEDEELAKLRGLVVLYAVIRKDGGVDKVRVIRSLNPALDERAIDALKQWKFKPARQGEKSIEVQALFGIPFKPQVNR